MPAYRSSAEADVRIPVVDHLRSIMPGCRIIHEINAASFGNRIDVLAVGEADLIAVEIKSERDKLDRLPEQIKAMRRVSNRVVAALHEKFLTTSRYGDVYPPQEANGAVVWVYPQTPRKGHVECGQEWRHRDRWVKPRLCLPHGALGMLWVEELRAIAATTGAKRISRMTMDDAADCIRWNLTGEQVTRAICAALRHRQCVEADPIAANDNDQSSEAA